MPESDTIVKLQRLGNVESNVALWKRALRGFIVPED